MIAAGRTRAIGTVGPSGQIARASPIGAADADCGRRGSSRWPSGQLGSCSSMSIGLPGRTVDSDSFIIPRAGERFAQRALRSSLGEVVDLSPHGMRVKARTVPKLNVDIELFALDKSERVRGRVAWSRRTGNFDVEIGIAFVGLTRRQARELESLSKQRHGGSFL